MFIIRADLRVQGTREESRRVRTEVKSLLVLGPRCLELVHRCVCLSWSSSNLSKDESVHLWKLSTSDSCLSLTSKHPHINLSVPSAIHSPVLISSSCHWFISIIMWILILCGDLYFKIRNLSNGATALLGNRPMREEPRGSATCNAVCITLIAP